MLASESDRESTFFRATESGSKTLNQSDVFSNGLQLFLDQMCRKCNWNRNLLRIKLRFLQTISVLLLF